MDSRITPDGITVKLKEVPLKVQLFKVVATNGDSEWVITNCASGSIDTQVVQNENKVVGSSNNCIENSNN